MDEIIEAANQLDQQNGERGPANWFVVDSPAKQKFLDNFLKPLGVVKEGEHNES